MGAGADVGQHLFVILVEEYRQAFRTVARRVDDGLIYLFFGGAAEMQLAYMFYDLGAEDVEGDVLVIASGDKYDLAVKRAQTGYRACRACAD